MAPRSFSLDAPALPTGLWKAMKQVLWAVMLSCALAGRASGATEMAVTIDDLPTHGALPKGTQRTAIAEQITDRRLPLSGAVQDVEVNSDDGTLAEFVK